MYIYIYMHGRLIWYIQRKTQRLFWEGLDHSHAMMAAGPASGHSSRARHPWLSPTRIALPW